MKDSGARLVVAHADLLSDDVRARIGGVTTMVVETPVELRAPYKISDDESRLRDGDVSFEVAMGDAAPFAGQPGPPTPAVFYTSGTTGKPKAVVRKPIPPEAAQALAKRTAFAFGLDRSGVRAVMTGPLYHSAPNAYALNIVRSGGCLVLQPKFDGLDLLSIIEREKITNLHMVPTMFQRLLSLPEEELRQFNLGSLRHVVHGAAPCPADVKRRMIEWLGPVVHEYYAMTEVGIIACSTSEQWLANPGTVGAPPPGVEIEIRTDDGAKCAPGEAGNICIRHEATHAFDYKNAETKTREMRQDNFVVTGDIGYLNENGFLFISDRKTDMILSGGVNIYPAEVEAALAEFEAVRDIAVFGVPDPDFGEKVVAYVETSAAIDEQALKRFLEARIAKFKTPRAFVFVDRLPREDSGKVKKRYLRDEYLSRPAERN